MWPTSAWWWAAAAWAEPPSEAPCEPLDEPAFRSYVLDAQAAIDRGDIELPSAILTEVRDQLRCLTFAPAPRMWADLLVAWAIVEFSRGGDWEAPLAGALRIRPAIDRGVGPGHPLAQWEPPPAPPGGAPLPSGARLYVDGMPSPTLPPAEGLYLVQKTDGRFWNTRLVNDGAVSLDWAVGPVDQPARIRWWTRLGGIGTVGSVEQAPSWVSDFYPEVAARQARVGAAFDLQATFFSPVGIAARAQATYATSAWLDAWIAAVVAPGRGTLGVGVGTASVPTLEDAWLDPDIARIERIERLQYGMAVAGWRSNGRSRWDATIAGGASPALVRYEVGAGLVLPPVGGVRWRLGLVLDGRRAVFLQAARPQREVTVGGVQAGLRLDWVAGEY